MVAVTGDPESTPVEAVMLIVSLNVGIVLLFTSRAVIRILNARLALCGGTFPPPVFSTRKLFNAPAITWNGTLAPVADPEVALIENVP